MGIEDKLNQAKGALKEGAGKLTGDKKTEIEGAVEKVVEKAKDGIKYVKEGVDDAFPIIHCRLNIHNLNKTTEQTTRVLIAMRDRQSP